MASEKEPSRAQRLNRILSLAGVTSRRKADELIRSGRVMVNGRVAAELGMRAVWGSDSINVDGREIPKPLELERVYLILNKPFGYISSLSDPRGRPVVIDLLMDVQERVYPVGRLDFDTIGLLLFTNDGEWAYRLTHPRYRVPKTYKATVDGRITDNAMSTLKRGVQLEDGPSGSSKVSLIARNERQSIVRITITQGKYRQVRRMFEAVGYRVVHLVRTGFANLSTGDLKVGEYRHLEAVEVEALRKMVDMA